MSRAETVGTLLADIANLINDGLRILSFADKRQWGLDEHEQVRALQEVLDDAKKDFQELPRLLNGQSYYERDRKHESMEELKTLRTTFQSHVQDLKDWAKTGGPINPIWVRETKRLQTELHRAQCRAARRIFVSGQEETIRCLGAFVVHRVQRSWSSLAAGVANGDYRKRYVDELLACKAVGSFERFGEHDIAFVCDFCDGHIVWEDLDSVPSARSADLAQADVRSPISPVSPINQSPYWQATGLSRTNNDEKQIIFAPVAIANHMVPLPGDWSARVICPYCEETGRQAQDADDDEDGYRPDVEFEDIVALQEHLEWQHASTSLANGQQATAASQSNCLIM
ncbi:hypothetical protein HJFPF1_11493 [Paramyrothecium foliicola]|nr:hypothetical protein HJFPF1_11493 [Paramyrothecium foliicola]